MRNTNPNFHGFIEPWRSLIKSPLLIFLLLSFPVDAIVVNSEHNQSLEWQVLTKRNFSTQIDLHHHILLMVTVPWSGESRSLMKKVADAASYKLDGRDDIRLMVWFKNEDKMLAEALGVTDETTIFFYHHAVSYKYQGRLRAQNIMSSVEYLISSQPEELPLKLLSTPEDLNTFLRSTDKAVLLFEFCGWTPRLLGNKSENDFPARDATGSGIISRANFYGETNLNLTSSRDTNQKGSNYEKLTCDTRNELGGIPGLGEFTTTNHSASSETENTLPDGGLSCTYDEFQKFESFLSKFLTFAREFFLPPERQRFGLVSERSLLSSLGVSDPDSWLVMMHFAGCPNCSKILKGGDDLKTAFGMHQLLVTELESEGHDVEFALPGNRPSAILFVDRSSESSNTRRKSTAALEMFRNLALHNQLSYQLDVQDNATQRKLLYHPLQRIKGGSSSNPIKHSRKGPSQLSMVDNFNNKMSVMIINEDGNIASNADTQGSSIQDIVAHLIRQQSESKLSFVAKEVGFQLLSDDFEVKLADSLQLQAETSNSNKESKISRGNAVESGLNLGKRNMLNHASSIPQEPEDRTRVADFEPSQFIEGRITYIVKNTQMTSLLPGQMVAENALSPAQDLVEEISSMQVDKLEVRHHHGDLMGFYFSDGGYQLLNSLMSSLEVPSLIIIDPVAEQHFIYPQEEDFSYSSLQCFFDSYLNSSLIPYQRSEFVTASPREAIHPPFVNLDFHEVDSIPRVTVHTFSEHVLGCNQSANKNIDSSWNKDVLVLFTNSWCGFCQRMELVVCEVFRAFNGYSKVLKSGSTNKESTLNIAITEDAKLAQLPLIFLMDCTLNDCSALLKSRGQREVYPALLLFPAQRKNAVSYHGDMSVNNIIKFLCDHGSNSYHLKDNGILWSGGQKGDKDEVLVEDAFPVLITVEEDSVAKDKYTEVLLNNRTPHTTFDLHEAIPNVVLGSVLIATDKLLNAPPFDNSKILIVQTNQSIGFQGLIINKPISWESFKGITKGIEFVKEAPLSFGGPVIANGMPLVSLTRRVIQDDYSEVFPGVYFLDQSATFREIEGLRLGNESANDYWFFLGYSSWGWEQLFAEIAGGAWILSNDSTAEFYWPE